MISDMQLLEFASRFATEPECYFNIVNTDIAIASNRYLKKLRKFYVETSEVLKAEQEAHRKAQNESFEWATKYIRETHKCDRLEEEIKRLKAENRRLKEN